MIDLNIEGDLATVRLANPPLNALDPDVLRDLTARWRRSKSRRPGP